MGIIKADSAPVFQDWVRKLAQDDGSKPNIALDMVDKVNQVVVNSLKAVYDKAVAGGLTKWVGSTHYLVDDIVWDEPSNKIYRCTTENTDPTFVPGNWQELSGAAAALFELGSGASSAQRVGLTNSAGGARSLAFGTSNIISAGGSESAAVGGTSNSVSVSHSAVVGGNNNVISGGSRNVIAGGRDNTISGCSYSGIFSGYDNTLSGFFEGRSVIVGGGTNDMDTTDIGFIAASFGTDLSGGSLVAVIASQSASVSAARSGILGGRNHDLYGTECVILGGDTNVISSGNEESAIVAARSSRILRSATLSSRSAIIGGSTSYITDGTRSVVLGGSNTITDSDSSIVGGMNAIVNGFDRCFVWSGGTGGISATDHEQFLINGSGGVGINTNAPKAGLHVNGSVATKIQKNLVSNLTIGDGPDDGHATLLLDPTYSALHVYLPAAANNEGRILRFKVIDFSYPIDVTPNGTEEIDGATGAYAFSALHEVLVIQSDGANWWKLN